MKKELYLKTLLLLALMLTGSLAANAHDFEVDGIFYNINGNEATVTYKGTSYSQYSNEYTGNVVIPSAVNFNGTTYSITQINNQAFYNCTGLTSVSIPNTINSIGYSAFNGCSSLTSVTIPNSVTSIAKYMFDGCTSLTSVTIPNSVITIDENAFDGCTGLTNIDIPNSVTKIGAMAFYNCRGLKSVTIPESVTVINDRAFMSCDKLSSVHITDLAAWCKINFYTNYLFSETNYSNPLAYAHKLYLNGTEVTELNIPNSVNTISGNAFTGCTSITSVSIPNSVTSIGENAFNKCSGMTSIEIPNSIISIGSKAFNGCSGLNSVRITDLAAWCSINFEDNYSNPLTYAHKLYLNGIEATELNIPNSVTSIAKYAFYGFSSLRSVAIPNSVTTISEYAFNGCSSLTSVSIPNSVTTISGYVFYNCRSLTSLIIPNSVTTIGKNAFYNCSGLTNVTIPNSVTSIGSYAFSSCSGLTSIHIADLAAWCNINFENSYSNPLTYAHKLYLNGIEVTALNIPNSVNTISNYAFNSCTGLTSVAIPNSISSIGSKAFDGCSSLASVQITDLAAWCSINFGADTSNPLTYAHKLYLNGIEVTELSIPNSVTSIAKYAFYNCSSLTCVTIPNAVSTINNYAFQGCTALKTLNFNAISCADFSSTSSYLPFYNLNITSIAVGDSVKKIPAYFAYGMTKLAYINIPNSVTTIGNYAFYGCSSMTKLIIGKSVVTIGNYAFRDCSRLSQVTSHPMVPPTISQYTFYGDYGASLYVHNDAYDVYCNTNYWNSFSTIRSINYIEFSDSVVKSLCIANWDMDKNGMLSFDEAEAVISLNNVFKGDSTITSFNELQYFTGLTSLGSFENCIHLESIMLPETLTSIYYSTFKNCSSLRYLKIPSSVTNIYFTAFENCPLDLEIADGNVNYMSENGAVYRIFDNSTIRQLMYVNNSCTSFSVKPFVSDIYEKAFWNATNLEYVTFEGYSGSTYQDYVSIGPLNGSGGNSYNTFQNCPLKEVVLNGPIKRTIWDSIYDNYYVFQNNETLEKVTLGSRITYLYDDMFDRCSNLSTVIAEGEITHVGVHAFRGTKWAEDESEDGVAYIGNYAASYDGESVDVSFKSTTSGIAKGLFSGVEGLGRVVLPTSVANTSNLMFYCSEVEEVVIPQNINNIAYNTFVYAKVRKLIIEDTDTTLNIGCSYDDPCGAFSDASVGTVIIGRPLKEYSKENLLNSSVQSNHPFGEAAIGKAIITRNLDISDWFNGCQVASVEFPQDLTSIGYCAFKYNNDYPSQYYYNHNYTYYYDERFLKSVTIPSTVRSIGYQAFYMSLLDTVTCLATTPPDIASSSFAYQYNYITLYVPAGCKAIYEATDVWKEFYEIIELAPAGDVNGDGNLSISDVSALISLLLSGGNLSAGADVNGDGQVNISDVTALISMLLSGN